MASWLVTGCNKGLGLELIKTLTKTAGIKHIIATARNEPSQDLQALAVADPKISIIRFDTLDAAQGKAAAEQVSSITGGTLDVLINNAGITKRNVDGIATATPADFLEVFTTNVGGVHNSTVAFLPLLKQGPTKKICNITSTLGCVSQVADNPFPVPAYKVSKAALNMLTAEWALQTTAKEGLIFIPLSPGWLKTGLGSKFAPLEVSVGAEATVRLINEATAETSGKIVSYDGTYPAW